MQLPIRSALKTLSESGNQEFIPLIGAIEKLVEARTPEGETLEAQEELVRKALPARKNGEIDQRLYLDLVDDFRRSKQRHPFASRTELRDEIAEALEKLANRKDQFGFGQ